MSVEMVTTRILKESLKDLNLISAITGEKQYQVVERLSKKEKELQLQKELKKKK